MDISNDSYDWKKYLSDVEPLVNRIYLFYGVFSFIVGTVQISIGYVDHIAVSMNALFCIILMVVFFLRKRIPVQIKTHFICFLSFISILSSHWFNGLMGTGFLQSLALILTVMIFYKTPIALFVTSLLVGIPFVLSLLVLTGRRVYSVDLFYRINSIGLWLPLLMNLIAIGLICVMALDYFRKEVFGKVNVLEKINRDLLEKEDILEHYAHYDLLTGLPNRNYFFEKLEKREERDTLKVGGALLLINIRQFRITNMLLGAEMADDVLQLIGEVLSGDTIDDFDMVCRLMGDEFLIWVDQADDATLLLLHKKIEKAIKGAVQREMSLDINLNVAAASYLGGRDHMQAVYSRAVLAMKRAKQKANSTLVFYREEMKLDFEEENRIYMDLLTAIEENEIVMFYHEQRKMDGKTVVGLESLARWKRKGGELISPELFVPVINKYNLILPFGYLTVDLVFRDVARLKEKYGPQITVSLNISPVLFLSTGFAEYLRTKKEAYHIGDNVLTLELTEDIFVEDREMLSSIFSDLKSSGFRISLDDFGTGYSSLSYLSRIDFDEVKIDKSLVDNIEDDQKQLGVIEVICRLAGTLNFSIVAEGVEREEQLLELFRVGCHYVQGFIHSKPRPLEELP
jgi:diguanylate cyclase